MNWMMTSATVPMVVAAGCATAGRVGEPLTETEVRQKVRHATGWDTLAERMPQGVRITGKASFLSLDQPTTLLFDHAGHLCLEQTGLVPLVRGLGTNGPWTLDIGGEYHGLELGDGDRMIAFGEALTGRWTSPSSRLVFSVDVTQTTDKAVVLGFTLKDEKGQLTATKGSVEIDRNTWHPRKWSIASGKAGLTIDMSGSLAVEAAWFPTNVVVAGQSTSTEYVFSEGGAIPTFVRSPFEPARAIGERPLDVKFDATKPALLETKRARTGHTLVKVEANGTTGWFIFDTGAGGTVIDSAFADKVGLKSFGQVEAVGVGGSVTTSFTRATLTVGPATLTDALLTKLDMSKIGTAMGTQIDGVLGYNLMHRAITKLSVADGTVHVYDPATFDSTGVKWHRLAVYDRHACVEGTFEGHTGFFKLDTGAGVQPVSIHAPTVERFDLLKGRETVDSVAGGVGGNVKMKRGKLAWIEVGGHREENVAADFAVENRGAFSDPYTMGNLSPAQIGPRDIVFDYCAGRIAYVPRKDAK